MYPLGLGLIYSIPYINLHESRHLSSPLLLLLLLVVSHCSTHWTRLSLSRSPLVSSYYGCSIQSSLLCFDPCNSPHRCSSAPFLKYFYMQCPHSCPSPFISCQTLSHRALNYTSSTKYSSPNIVATIPCLHSCCCCSPPVSPLLQASPSTPVNDCSFFRS